MIEILIAIVLLFIIGGIRWGYLAEKRNWNNGRCSYCGAEWICFDIDSQGGRGYKCSDCHKYIWISYSFIDKMKKKHITRGII